MNSLHIPFSLIFLFFLSTQFHLAEMAVGRALVKAGNDFTYENVPGKILVMRTTKAHKDPQYLWAGNGGNGGGGWTTDGVSN
jgi:hypothetical protein